MSIPLVPGADARTYGPAFFDKQAQASLRSAAVIVPAVLALIDCASVVDVGCGVGPWLRTVKECGIDDYLGIDGDWVPADRLDISADRFHAHDLRRPLKLGRRFDLAICVEVAEHLPADAAATLVDTLTSLAPVILFSAAVPDQGGDGHINEQWPGYWAALFRQRNFAAHDCIRMSLWNDSGADWWYRQNVLLYADRSRTPKGIGEPIEEPLALVHPDMIQAILTRPPVATSRVPVAPALDDEPPTQPAPRTAPTGWRSALGGVRRGRSGR